MRTIPLPNGITVVLNRTRDKTATVVAMLDEGSRHDPPNLIGAHHGLEHSMARATEKFPSWEELNEEADWYCTEFNAETDKQTMVFYAETNAKKIRSAIGLIAQEILHPLITKEQVADEHGRLSEERRLSNDLVDDWVGQEYDRLTLRGGLGHTIDGPVSIIRRYTPATLKKLYRRLVVGKRLTIVITGGFNPDEVLKTIRRQFETMWPGRVGRAQPLSQRPQRSVIRLRHIDMEQVHFMVGFATNGIAHADRHALQLLRNHLNGRPSALVKKHVDSKGLVYTSGHFLDFFPDIGQFGIKAELAPEKLLPMLRRLAMIFEELCTALIDEKKFQLTKTNLIMQTEKYFADPLRHGLFIARQRAVFGKYETVPKYLASLNQVTRRRLQKVACRTFVLGRMYVVAAGPLGDITKQDIREAIHFRTRKSKSPPKQ